ncbi:MAG TPA: hypothetical protein PK122_01345 [Candidatus Paceibacterota bacterium]|nr:hypothetical protein [Candidatus Paceibacterota bacterium]
MLLLAEIILTIFAWRKGYKWLSLLPLGVGLITGFILGAGIAASGGDVVTARGLSIFIDLLVIVALVGMLLAKKQTKDLEKTDLTENK